ncbi:hypothetical protein PF004_g29965 [Phytophthora fragariae]|uniref:Uncharacterized protein n=1 Tax=Phytophthora fragariae TaxID=53985 RepID=A0A6G0MDB6_9STRA|nr:hypothetical protein PF004_g29965 [Phytophthora fragariae]
MPLGRHRSHSSICAAGEEPRDQRWQRRWQRQLRRRQQQYYRTKLGPGQAPPGSRASRYRTATATSSGGSSIAG